MADIEIKIITAADVAGLKKATDATKELNRESANFNQEQKKSEDTTDKLVSSKAKWIDVIKKLSRDIPGLGYAVSVLKNPLTTLAFAIGFGIVKFREYSQSLKDMVSSVDGAKRPVEAWSDKLGEAATAIASLAVAQKTLEEATNTTNGFIQAQIELLDASTQQQVKVLDAQEQVEAAEIEAGTQDPVERAKRLRENALVFGARRLGMQGSLPGQKAQLVDRQIEAERRLQLEAAGEVPRREDLMANAQEVQAAAGEVTQRQRENREAFGRVELLRRFAREAANPQFFKSIQGMTAEYKKTFAPADIRELRKLGLLSDITEVSDPTGITDAKSGVFLGDNPRADLGRTRELLVGAEESAATARDRLARARGRLSGARGAAKGVFAPGDVDPYLSEAESRAAATGVASQTRLQQLEALRARLLVEQSNTVVTGGLNQRTSQLRGDIAVSGAERSAASSRDEQSQQRLRQFLDATSLAGPNASANERLINYLQRQKDAEEALVRKIERLESRDRRREE